MSLVVTRYVPYDIDLSRAISLPEKPDLETMRELGHKLIEEIEAYSKELAIIQATSGNHVQRTALFEEVFERPAKKDYGLKLPRQIPSYGDLSSHNMEELLGILEKLWSTLKFIKAMRAEDFGFAQDALSTYVFTSEQNEITSLWEQTAKLVHLTYGGGQNSLESTGRGGCQHILHTASLRDGFEDLVSEAVRHFLAQIRDDFAQKLSRAAGDILFIVHEKVPSDQLFDNY